MKEIKFLSMLLLVFATTLFVSCGDDDSDDNSSTVSDSELINRAVGVWMCTQSTDTQQGKSYRGLMVGKEVTILANGTYTSTASSFGYSGTYSVSGNKITARSDAGGTFVITVTFNSSQMEWQGTASNGVSFNYLFDRESSELPQTLNFTKELLIGDGSYNSWMIESFTINRGSNSNIKNGKTLIFKEDGSCSAFHSMETAWRINNGKVETYYKATNEPMYVYTLLTNDSKKIIIRMNGTLDDDLQATISLSKVMSYYEPEIEVKTDSIFYIQGIYNSCVKFVEHKLCLEGIRTNPETVHNITPSSSEISQTFLAAYKTINNANYYISHYDMTKNQSNYMTNSSLAETKAIRAFVYYNLAMLWGAVPFFTSPIINISDAKEPYQYLGQNEVYLFAYNEICEILEDLPESSNAESDSKLCFNRDAGIMLKAELEMTLGYKEKAINTLGLITRSKYETQTRSTMPTIGRPVIWALQKVDSSEYIPIYTFIHNQLYLYEATGSAEGLNFGHYATSIGEDASSENALDIVTEWLSQQYVDYGLWAALKRLGKAQEVTGCYDYELLMPYSSADINADPNLNQNPGY